MLPASSSLPIQFRLLNTIGHSLRALHLPVARLEEEALCRDATRATGLTDFGEPHYRAGLQQVLASANQEAQLSFLGRLAVQSAVMRALVTRLRLIQARKQQADIFQQPLLPPLILLGLPRSGTTLLHRLLAADPMHRALPLWELLRPFPERDGSAADAMARQQAAERAMRFQRAMMPTLDQIHHVRADLPEECFWFLNVSFVSAGFWMVAPLYNYLDWYQQQPQHQAYQEYAWLLQVIQANTPTQRLTLKAPPHTGALDALLQAIPQALLIQTHRDPIAATTSFNSLSHTVYHALTTQLDGRRVAESNLHWMVWLAQQSITARQTYPQAVYDVFYDELVADPVNVVQGIYHHFGLPWTRVYQERLRHYLQDNPKGKYGQHRYQASDFGQSEAEITERFAAYIEHFGPFRSGGRSSRGASA